MIILFFHKFKLIDECYNFLYIYNRICTLHPFCLNLKAQNTQKVVTAWHMGAGEVIQGFGLPPVYSIYCEYV